MRAGTRLAGTAVDANSFGAFVCAHFTVPDDTGVSCGGDDMVSVSVSTIRSPCASQSSAALIDRLRSEPHGVAAGDHAHGTHTAVSASAARVCCTACCVRLVQWLLVSVVERHWYPWHRFRAMGVPRASRVKSRTTCGFASGISGGKT